MEEFFLIHMASVEFEETLGQHQSIFKLSSDISITD